MDNILQQDLISVIMPVYNAERYVYQAIDSVLNQTYKNIELIVINDGSTDNSKQIIQSINDLRIKYIDNDENSGIVFSRNRGVKLAKGNFVGMVDADDIVHPEKFEQQINFLNQNPDFGMVGSWVRFINEDGNRLSGGWKLKAPPAMITSIMLFKNYFLQSAVLYRTSCLNKFSFEDGFDILEDYLIWFRILKECKAWNLPKYLVDYRVHGQGVTKKHDNERVEKEKRVFSIQLKEIGIDASDHELELHSLIRTDEPIKDIKTLKDIHLWLLKIKSSNKKSKQYNDKYLSKVVANRWLKACKKAEISFIQKLRVCLFSRIFCIFQVNNIFSKKITLDG